MCFSKKSFIIIIFFFIFRLLIVKAPSKVTFYEHWLASQYALLSGVVVNLNQIIGGLSGVTKRTRNYCSRSVSLGSACRESNGFID